ncbi:hypothetical protein [Methanobrevibacter sp.]|uniref:hypothetical protein n=1 Tax=Methanobrevibacter sp. TaxID=66852 RepID=UPI00388E0119
MFKKIFFVLFIGLISIGVVAAVDVGNFNVPEGFDDLGSGVFIFQSSKGHDQYLTIVPFNNHYKADYLINDSSDGYFIFLYKNNTFNYVEKSVNEQGSFEIIEVDGKKYIIDFSDDKIKGNNDFSDTHKWLVKFNKLNNVTAVNTTAL